MQVRQQVSPYRALAAMVFDRLCLLSGRTTAEICDHLRERLERDGSMSRHTLRSWRHADTEVPFGAILAVAELSDWRLRSVEQLVLGEVVEERELRHAALMEAVNKFRAGDAAQSES